MMIAGEAHAVSLVGDSQFNYAKGFCVLKGFSTFVSAEGNGDMGNGPFVLLNNDGSVMQTSEGPVGNLYPYRSITCK